MQPWPAPHVPALPGAGPALRLAHDAIGHPVTTGGPGPASLVLLTAPPGPAAPLAHLAPFIAADVVLRTWHDAGLPVTYVVAVLDDGAPAVGATLALELTTLGVVPPHAVVAGDLAAVADALRADGGTACDLLVGAADVAPVLDGLEALLSAGAGAPDAPRAVQRRLVVPGPAGGPAVAVADAPEGSPSPMAVRLLVLAHRCRDAWAFGPDDVAAAEARLARWIEAVSGNGGPPFDDLLAEVRAAVADDLDTPRALAAVDAWADAALAVGTPAGPAEEDLVEGSPGVVARAIDALLGVRV